MATTKTFKSVKAEHLKTLKRYVPIVDRVHGGNHPEFHEVRRVFEQMAEKMSKTRTKLPALDEEFVRLRDITGNYAVPADVCESYEAVYQMLSDLDHAYQAETAAPSGNRI